jgi:hypothetical protein
MKFTTNNSAQSAIHIVYREKNTEETVNTKFLGLQIDNHLNWKNHIKEMMPKWSMLCMPLG